VSDYTCYLNELLREEIESMQADAQALRNSLRYRVGGVVLEAFPPSLQSFPALWRLVRLYRQRSSRSVNQPTVSSSVSVALPEEALSATHLMLASAGAPIPGGWVTEHPHQLALRLDRGPAVAELTLRKAAVPVTRRLARLKAQGGRLVWWPEPGVAHNPALVAYIEAHADECWEGEST
jgi:hypothetical protein